MGENPPLPVNSAQVRAQLDWFRTEVLIHEPALRARMRRALTRRDDIDDIVAETLTRAFAAAPSAPIENARAWLFRIARNIITDQARREKVIAFDQLGEGDLIACDAVAEARLEARDTLRRLQHIIDDLPIQCRRAFVLRRVYDRPVAEIAETMGLSVFTVDKHIARATAKVMLAMGEFEDSDVGQSIRHQRTARGT